MGRPLGEDLKIAQRRTRIARLKVCGYSVREIAEEIGCCTATVSNDMKALREEWRKERLDDVEEARTLELKRLDIATQKILDHIQSSATTDAGAPIDLMAIDRLAKIGERRSKLLGLDQPERKEIVGELTPDTVSALVRETFQFDDRQGDEGEGPGESGGPGTEGD